MHGNIGKGGAHAGESKGPVESVDCIEGNLPFLGLPTFHNFPRSLCWEVLLNCRPASVLAFQTLEFPLELKRTTPTSQ